jgi:integrase
MSDGAAGELLKRMGRKDLTPHGCRSTFRDFAAECTTFQREVAEAALAHYVGGVEGAYQRGDFLEKRRALMQAWADFCATPIIESDQDNS